MASLHGEVGTIKVRLGRRLPTVTWAMYNVSAGTFRRLLWFSMAIAARQKIMTTSGVRRIPLYERQRCYLLFCHAFTGCDTVSAIGGHGKTTLFDRFCAGDIDKHMKIFLDALLSH